MLKKFTTMVGSWFNYGIDELTDPIKVAELKLVQNKTAITKTGALAADLYAEGLILDDKIKKLKDVMRNDNALLIEYSKEINADSAVKGKALLAKYLTKQEYLATMESQLKTAKEQRAKLEEIIDKIQLKTDMITTELHIIKTKSKASSNVKDVLQVLAELSDVDTTSGVMDDIKRETHANDYQVDKYFSILDAPDTEIDSKWEEFKKK